MQIPGFKSWLCALSAATAVYAQAAPHHVGVGTALPRFSLLKEGTQRYVRYVKSGAASTPVDIWTREVRFEHRHGERLLRVRQRWDGAGPAPSTRLLDSWFEPGTLRPRTHERISERDGKRVVEGFAFSATRMDGLKDLADNTQKDLAVESSEPAYNFEADIELLQSLPLAEGYEARINLYHPGGQTMPQRYLFKVAGSATIAGPAGPVDCWIVTTDYNRTGALTRFWFAKGTQVMLRQESPMRDKLLVKALIE
jgi:hypothetical protein